MSADTAKLRRTIHAVERRNGATPSRPPFPRTDAGNAQLFAELHGDRVRFDHARGEWLLFHRHWWGRDPDEEVRRLAVDTARYRYQRAGEIEDLTEREREAKFAIKSENRSGIEAMLRQAQAEHPIADAGEGWDADPYALAVLNGVLDLRTGKLRDGRPEDRISKHAPVTFDPNATCPTWERAFGEWLPDADVRDHVRRYLGYCATGDPSEQVFQLWHGREGGNGKTTCGEAVSAVLGPDFARAAAPGLLLAQNGDPHPARIADIVGARLVISAEFDEGRRLAESLVKQLTGGDRLKSRRMYGNWIESPATHKIVLITNHRPVIRGTDDAIWRRVRLIPWTVTIPPQDRDPHLQRRLAAEASGILNWLIAACLDWQRGGLREPDAVMAARDDYRAASDEFAAFLDDRCVTDPQANVAAAAFYGAYKAWANAQGMGEREISSATAFGRRMGDRFARVRRRAGPLYSGVRLREHDEDRSEPVEPVTIGVSVTGSESSNPSHPNLSLDDLSTREKVGKPVTTRNPSQPVADTPDEEIGDRLWV